MARRFDEVDLLPEPTSAAAPALTVAEPMEVASSAPASRWRRIAAALCDLSLFIALGLVLSPLLPPTNDLAESLAASWPIYIGYCGFLLLLSYHYFSGSWLLWGKTIGGAIFDVRVVADDERSALSAVQVSKRWGATLLSVVTAGLTFVPALLPSRRSVADRLSSTHCVRA